MSIGNKEVYPLEYDQIDARGYPYKQVQNGLTYREWLIGMLASNPAIWQSDKIFGTVQESDIDLSKDIVRFADAIINLLDKEVTK